MDAYTPDLSGEALEYYVTNYQRTVFRSPQKLLFDVPVHRNSKLEVILLGPTNQVLVNTVDYQIQVSDMNYDAMSVCKEIDSSFTGALISSITMIRPIPPSYRVQVKFNQLYADQINYARINSNRQIEVTPTLISNMVEQLDYLQQMVLSPTDVYSPQSSTIKILAEDPSGQNPDNLIIDEEHDLNTLNGVSYIRPIYGSFFRDSVVVKNAMSGVIYNVDDYEILEVDMSRTRATSNHSGVYQIIRMLASVVGQVKVSYVAYGGIADISSMRNIHDRLRIVEDYLSSTSYITPSTLAASPSMIAIQNKLLEMDGNMRLLLQNGLPSYGDVSTGTALLKKVVASDAAKHWWSIATLYRVQGSADNVYADVFKFRLKSLLSGMMFECSVSVNAFDPISNRLSIECSNSNLPVDVLEKLSPSLRTLQVTTGGVYSGVVLQLGMKLGIGILQETFDIEDMSGRESCWKLVPFNSSSTPPEDTSVLMPNGTAVFTLGSPTSIPNHGTIPFKSDINLLTDIANVPVVVQGYGAAYIVTTELDDVVQEFGDIDPSKIKALKLNIKLNVASTIDELDVVLPMVSYNFIESEFRAYTDILIYGKKYGIACIIRYDLAEIEYVVDFNIAKLETNPAVNTFNITKVRLVF